MSEEEVTGAICFADVELVGSRIRLRPIRPEDALGAYGLLVDDQVTRTLLWDGPSSLEELIEAYGRRAEWWETGVGTYTFGIEVLGSSSIVGSIDARIQAYPQVFEIGYWLGVPHWGKGLMTDAVRLTVHFVVHHLRAVRIAAGVFVGNGASSRVLENNGFRLEGTLRSNVLKRGDWLDEQVYALLRPEWEHRRDAYRPEFERVMPA